MRKLVILILLLIGLTPLVWADKYYNLEGREFTYPELISAPKTVLFAWTTWCPACRADLRTLAHDKTLPADVNILFVNIGESQATVEDLLDHLRLSDQGRKKVFLDKKQALADKFTILAVPTVIFFKDKRPIHVGHFLNKELIEEIFKDE